MAVTFSNGIFTKTVSAGESGFFACINPNNFNEIQTAGYAATKVRSKLPIVEAPASLILAMEGELPAFLMTLYNAGIPMDSEKPSLDLDAVIEFNSLQDDYTKVHPLDFAVLTGRKDYPQIENHIRTPENPNPPARPEMKDVPDGDPLDDQMLAVLKFLGISSYIHRLYASEAMNWDEYVECFTHFWGTDPMRAKSEIGTLQTTLPAFQRPPLSKAKLKQLILA